MPRVLLLYYTYTQQARRVADVVAETFRARGMDVQQAAIEFTDPRYAERFSRFPFRRPYIDLFRMFPPQLRRATGEVRVPDIVTRSNYDLVCIGSPTWWLTTNMPVRSFLESDAASRLLSGKKFAAFVVCRRYWRNNLETVKKLGVKQGGEWLGGVHFAYAGGQIRSLLSLTSYLATGENRERYLGVKIPPTNLEPGFEKVARGFAAQLADRLETGAASQN
jgi:menaquinone-dependent protoporphyrinogen IX oxidase